MQISFTDDQRLLRESMRGFFTRRSPLSSQRRASAEVPGLPGYWAELAQLDLLDVGVSHDGESPGGARVMDLVPLYLEMGRSLSLSPHLETAIVAAGTIAALDPDADVLKGIASGTAIVIPAVRDGEGQLSLDAPGVSATVSGRGWLLRGVSTLVPFAQVADHLLVPARAPEGACLFIVPADSPGISRALLPNIASLPLFRLDLDGVAAPAESRLGGPGEYAAPLAAALDRACVLRCAAISGAGERLLELCVGYAKTREQFGKAIGSFQAVQYLCTDIAIATRVTLLLAAQAGGRMDDGRPYRAELEAARRYAKRTVADMVSASHELHAGVGFMDEHDLHLFTRRGRFWDFDLDGDGDADGALIDRYAAGTSRSEGLWT